MAATIGSKIASLVLRVLTFVFLFISIIILATNTKIVNDTKISFSNVNGYRYVMATIIVGGAFNLLQIAFALYHIIMKGDGYPLVEFFGDKFLSYLLLSGAAAGLGAGIDLRANLKVHYGNSYDPFLDMGNGAVILLLLAFLCSAVVSILSSLALIKKP